MFGVRWTRWCFQNVIVALLVTYLVVLGSVDLVLAVRRGHPAVAVNSTLLGKYELNKPVIVLSLPKSGTTSLASYFRCGGVRTSHWKCGAGFCANCLALKSNGTKLLQKCGGFSVYAELSHVGDTSCIVPQLDMLDRIHKDYPKADFILSVRPSEHWLASMKAWHAYDARMRRCRNLSSNSQLEALYRSHTAHVENFVKKYPSHRLIKFDLENTTMAEERLEKAFGIPGTCWVRENCRASC